MKNFTFIFFLLCLFSGSLYAQRKASAGPGLIKGRVVNLADSTQPIAFSHIYNKKSEKGVISDADGWFRVMASSGDSMEFRMVGYVDTTLSLQQITALRFRVPLRERVYKLRQVQVTGSRYQRPFAPASPSTDPYVGYRSVKPSGRLRQRDEISLGGSSMGGAGASVVGGVTALANQFNSKEKQREKIRELKAQEEQRKYYQALFGFWFEKEYVAGITGYKGAELNRFIKFCKPSLKFLEEATEYEIITAIQKYQRQYTNINQY